MTPEQKQRIEEIRERRIKATPPPWGPHEMTPLSGGLHEWIEVGPYPHDPVCELTNDYKNYRENADFIANAPDDIDFLLSLVKSQAAVLRTAGREIHNSERYQAQLLSMPDMLQEIHNCDKCDLCEDHHACQYNYPSI